MKLNDMYQLRGRLGARVVAAAIVSFAIGLLRTWYTTHFFGYSLQVTDPVIAYFFYELLNVCHSVLKHSDFFPRHCLKTVHALNQSHLLL